MKPEVRREQLLDAATQVFAERGYEGARVEQIADAAQVSPGLLYRHFEGKQELYAEILQLANRELMEHLAQAAAPKRPSSERVREGLDAFFTFVEDHRALWQMLMKDVLEPEIAEIREQVTTRSVMAVATLAAQDYDANSASRGRARDGVGDDRRLGRLPCLLVDRPPRDARARRWWGWRWT